MAVETKEDPEGTVVATTVGEDTADESTAYGSITAKTRRPINDAPRGVRQQTTDRQREVRFYQTRIHRGTVHAAVRTAMAELGSTPVSGYRDNVDGPGGGRSRNLSACAIRARGTPQQRASSNSLENGAASRAEPY